MENVSATTKNGTHYSGSVTTIDKQEDLMRRLVTRIDADRAFDLVTASKYFDRAGRKEGEDFEKDMSKCADYMVRAMTGGW